MVVLQTLLMVSVIANLGLGLEVHRRWERERESARVVGMIRQAERGVR